MEAKTGGKKELAPLNTQDLKVEGRMENLQEWREGVERTLGVYIYVRIYVSICVCMYFSEGKIPPIKGCRL